MSMSTRIDHVIVSCTQDVLLAATYWCWDAFCTTLAAKLSARGGYFDARCRDILSAGLLSLVFITATVVDMHVYPKIEVLGIHGVSLSPPASWIAGGLLLLVWAPAVILRRLRRARPLLIAETRRTGSVPLAKPRLTQLVSRVVDALLAAGGSLAGRS
jgi:hypothetical protein